MEERKPGTLRRVDQRRALKPQVAQASEEEQRLRC